MRTLRYTWLVECPPSQLSQNADVVSVSADAVEASNGALIFWERSEMGDYPIAAFAPGHWLKLEVCEAAGGTGNGMFASTPPQG